MTVFESSFYEPKINFQIPKMHPFKNWNAPISGPSIKGLIKFVFHHWELMVALSGHPDNRLSRHGSRCHLEKDRPQLNSLISCLPWSSLGQSHQCGPLSVAMCLPCLSSCHHDHNQEVELRSTQSTFKQEESCKSRGRAQLIINARKIQ